MRAAFFALIVLAASTIALAAAAPAAHARTTDATPPDWIAPTPPDGQTYVVDAGADLAIDVAASDADPTAVVELSVTGAPAKARLTATPGNPASGKFTWSPTFSDVGGYELTFAAKVAGGTLPPTTRTIEVQVRRPPPFKLSGVGPVSRWAYVQDPTYARAQPRGNARIVSRISTLTPEFTPNLVMLLDGTYDDTGHVWIRVRLAILPNNSTAWVRREALGSFHSVTTHVVVSRSALRLTLYRNGRAAFHARVGVGHSYWPTPRGEFYVRDRLTGFDDPFYGPLAFGLSARSAVLTDWPGGGFIGIHGTNAPQLLPGFVSHGCVRMRNPDILRLARMLPLGTPVTIN